MTLLHSALDLIVSQLRTDSLRKLGMTRTPTQVVRAYGYEYSYVHCVDNAIYAHLMSDYVHVPRRYEYWRQGESGREEAEIAMR